MANEMDRCTENQGRTAACSISSMPECDEKGQGEDIGYCNPKQAGSWWFARRS